VGFSRSATIGTAAEHVRNAAKQFLTEMAGLMGLPAGGADALCELASVRGYGGFLCRLQIAQDNGALAVRPEVVLPIAARDLNGMDVERLLIFQRAMADELRWIVGMSDDGMLYLSSLDWIDEPKAAVAAMDLGQVLAGNAMHELIGGIEPAHDGVPARPR
jgi:hypothetical protein